MTYKLSNAAKRDVARIYWRGVEIFGEEQAVRYFEALIQRFERIAQAPRLYPSVEYIQEGYRRSVCGVDSIYYRVNGRVVEIMRVLGRQDIDENL